MSPAPHPQPGVELGLLLPTSEPTVFDDADPLGRLADLARRAEGLGYDSLWAGESLQSPRFEPLAVLAAAAAVTDRARLGTAAMIPAYRQPVATAQQLATLDRLARGRLALGLGAGFPSPRTEAAFALAGADYHRRAALLDDIAGVWQAIWSGATTFDGALLHLDQLPPAPAHTPQGPPLWLASATPAALERAGRHYDGWLPYSTDPASYAAGLAAVTHARLATGRPPTDVTPALFVTAIVTDDHADGETQLDAYCHSTYAMPAAVVRGIQLIVVGHAAHVADSLTPYVDTGARHLVVRIGTLHTGDQPERIAEALAPLRTRTAPVEATAGR